MKRRLKRFEVFDAIRDGVTVQDTSGNLVYANPAGAAVIGYDTPEDLIAAPVEDVMKRFMVMDEAGDPLPLEQLPGRQAMQGAFLPEVIVRWRRVDDPRERWASVTAHPLFDGRGDVELVVNVFRDVTEERRAQLEVSVRVRQQAVVAELGHLALTGIDLTTLMQETVERLVETLHVEYAEVLELLPHRQALLVRAGVGWKDGLVGEGTVSAGPSSQAGYTLLARQPVVVTDLRGETRFSGPPLLHDHGVVSGASVTIQGRGSSWGVLGVHATERRAFDEDDIHFLEAVANVLAAAIDRREAEEGRAKLLAAEREARTEAEAARERLALLAEAGTLFSSSLDYVKTLQRVADVVVERRLADWCTVDVLDDDGQPELVAVAHNDPEKREWARDFRRRYAPRTDRGIAQVIRTGEPELYPEISDSLLTEAARGEEHLRALRALAPRSAMLVPLASRGRTFGALSFVAADSDRRYDEEDLTLAMLLARRAALAIDNARLYGERSHIARTLQRSLLPPALPEIPGLDVAVRYRSAEGSEVGGDFYDLFEIGDEAWIAVIGDVCGRGIEAASLTGLVRQTLRTLGTSELSPREIVRMVNDAIVPQARDTRFFTIGCVRLELENGKARADVCIGGHPPPMLVRSDGTVETVGAPGTLLGVLPDPELHDRSAILGPGDALVLYTDGVTAAFETANIPGESGLAGLLQAGLDATALADRVERGAVESRTSPERDDMALMVLRLTD